MLDNSQTKNVRKDILQVCVQLIWNCLVIAGWKLKKDMVPEKRHLKNKGLNINASKIKSLDNGQRTISSLKVDPCM